MPRKGNSSSVGKSFKAQRKSEKSRDEDCDSEVVKFTREGSPTCLETESVPPRRRLRNKENLQKPEENVGEPATSGNQVQRGVTKSAVYLRCP